MTIMQGTFIYYPAFTVKKLGFREVKNKTFSRPQVSGRAGTRIQNVIYAKSSPFLLHHDAFEKNLRWLGLQRPKG